MKRKGLVGLLLTIAMITTACGTTSGDAASLSNGEVDIASLQTGNQSLEISCHDPQILNDKGTYYMTGSHIVLAKSDDLQQWDYISNGNAKNYISNLYSGDLEAFSYVGKNEDGGYSLWAGNIFYNETMGKYCLYFCTSSTYIKSTLALAVSDTPEGPYEYTDTLLYSGFSKKEADQTDLYDVIGDADDSRYFKLGGYNNELWPNCIDPA
ncbi:MAG: family 43 glycosylhydrolase, partial [Lachnospiraceae bacterium]|nr:family 43 glycosylhydrolase [Lachnospiraceae bacterium]